MRQTDLNRAVAKATGDSVSDVARHGFQLLEPDRPPLPEAELLDREDPSSLEPDPTRTERLAS
ncbi:MAG: hypothetical protein IT428_22410 [Planctomycetaceae bacterium]|nr:hypothetical protein [Planctomycetaceae bacterium]